MNKSVIKALKLLDYFTDETPERTLKEITKVAKIPKPTVYRMMKSLEYCGYIIKTKESEHNTTYRLGLKLLELGHRVSEQLEIRKVALPYMKELGTTLNEVVHLVVEHNNEAVYIEKVESNRVLRLYTKIGKRSPLYLGSGPKLLLAFSDEKKQHEILHHQPLSQLTNDLPVDKNVLYQQLKMIRQNGYAMSVGEQDKETTGVSYPVFDYHGKVIAAIAVSGLSIHFTGDALDKIKLATKKCTEHISAQLGYRQ